LPELKTICRNLHILESSSSHDEHGEEQAQSSHVGASAQLGDALGLAVNVQVDEGDSGEQVGNGQEVENSRVEVGSAAGGHSGGEWTEVLEAVGDCGFGAAQTTLGGDIEDAVVFDDFDDIARRTAVKLLVGLGLVGG
jgi:hypothetical protein